MRVDMLLVVGAGRDDIVRLRAEHLADAVRDRFDDRRVALGHQRQHLHHVADLVVEFRPLALQPVEDGRRPRPSPSPMSSSSRKRRSIVMPAGIRHVGRGQAGAEIVGLPAMDRIDVHGRAPRALGHHRHARAACGRAPGTAPPRRPPAPPPCGAPRNRRGTASSHARSRPWSRSPPTRRRGGRGRCGPC